MKFRLIIFAKYISVNFTLDIMIAVKQTDFMQVDNVSLMQKLV